ncbi:RNase A-like domain-containing protein [Mesorhizobium sp. PUT5]|uniref:RNase A-like domain-containing protein n=1 Tax=Mesorhizobium sp. PUT5 TaxID=3454629 RepID=UPI003FA4C1BF
MPAGNPDGGQWTGGGGAQGGWLQYQPVGSDDRNELRPGYRVDLLGEEAAGGHTIHDHVGRSPEALLARVRGERYISIFSTVDRYRDGSFPSIQAANKLVNATLSQDRSTVDAVASGLIMKKTLVTATFSSKTGVEAFRGGEYEQPYLLDTYGVGVVIVHDPDSARGFRIVTAYPRND